MKRVFIVLSMLVFAVALFANDKEQAKDHNKQSETEFDPTSVIMHHISDAHVWHLFDLTDKVSGQVRPIGIPLPVIVYYKGNIDVFMSSKFHHGHSSVIKGDNEYLLYEDKIYLAENGKIVFNNEHQPTNIKPLDFSITKNVASLFFAAILVFVVFVSMARMYKKGNGIPRGIQGFLEPIVMFVVDDIAKPNIGEHKYEKYLPYLLTVFFFIWFSNMLGLIPIFPGGANLTGNIAVTMTLAGFTMIITSFSGSKTYWGHIIAPPVPKWLWFIMIPVEFMSVLSKPFALMIRLFANITAGHIIVLSLVSLIFIFKTVWISPVSIAFVLFMDVLELLVAILQAYIFTLLSALFIGLAAQEHH